MTVIPLSWRIKLAHNYLTEALVIILVIASGWFGASIVVDPNEYRRVLSFQQAFEVVPPHWWGLSMVVLAVAMLALLIHSRAAAAIPTFLLGIVWVSWVIPIAFSPGFAPSAPIVYSALSAFTLLAGFACLVPRKEGHDRP